MFPGPEKGWASSASVYVSPLTPGRWNWNASGPNGITSGSAMSEERAWEMAREAQAQLNRQMTPRGIG